MKWSDYDEYLNPTHFGDKKDVTLTIREVTADEVYSQSEKRNVQTPVIWFRETKKGLVLSRTNRRTLAQAFGDDAASCIGRKVVLKITPMRVAGKDMQVIRIHIAPGAPNGQPQPRPDELAAADEAAQAAAERAELAAADA
jgi:hypothetical protein